VNRRVLVVRFSSLGDVILTAPVFEILKKSRPGVHTTFLTKIEYAELHRANPHLDEVRAFDLRTESFRSVVDWVRNGDFDLFVDLHRSLRSRFISIFSGVPASRYSQDRLRRFMVIARPRFGARKGMRPVVERYLEVVGWEGKVGSDPDSIPRLYLKDEDLQLGRQWRERLQGELDCRLGVLLPGAKHPPKQWPIAYFSELAQMLAWRGDIPVLMPPPGREEIAADVVNQAGVEGVRLSEPHEDAMGLASALAAADAVVANDSGPMHVAAAVGVPVVGIFGPTSPELGFAPLGRNASWVHLGLFCSPCSKHGKYPCWRGKRYCLNQMVPELVIEALDDLFERVQAQKDLDL